ncbi:hypothetical protein [Methylobacterium sp. 391_Methyba4]|uniref:hypothetical protein n=1 Tax=Methylobacterium sp. 391_Methyba4 TaxID=3038924 RepID=UPI00241DE662|nr:hypothetical protein [Methylobacterium sp. 391_Methyba4]WFS10373.1 hypothetical protein P9K36_14310 [Methylobacterium sp. 391_Methyba4]
MATHAHSTRTSLLRPSDRQGLSRFAQTEQNARSLLGAAPGRQSGPVTVAIAALRSADPDLDRQRLRELRRRIADRIEADLALLDALDGDADLEPSLAACEPILGGGLMSHRDGRVRRFEEQEHWAGGATDDREQDAGDEREEEDEHGGDIQDEPHDEEPDREPRLQPVFMGGGGYALDSFGGRA